MSAVAATFQRTLGRGGRDAALTLFDQIVSSGTNFAVGVLVARAGGADTLGAYGIAFLVWVAAFGVNRALVTDPMTVQGVIDDGNAQLREGMATTLLLGLGWAALLAAAGGVGLLAGVGGVALLALAPWLPSLLLQDYWRATAFRLHRADRALVSDVVFAVAQGSVTLVLFVVNIGNVAAYLASWGIGGTAGALVGLCMFRVRPALRGGLAHLCSLWSRSRWFLAEYGTAFISDQGYLLLLPALVSTSQFGIYRAGFSLIGPVIIIYWAGMNVGLPECVRRLRQHGMPGLMTYTPRLSVAVLGLTTAYAALVAILAGPLLRLVYGSAFVDGAIITQLVAAQYIIFSIGFGCGVALKASGRIRQLWVMRIAGAVVSVTGVTVLASSLGLVGAGLAGLAAALTYTLGILGAYRRMR